MGLVIEVSKLEALKVSEVNGKVSLLCEKIVDQNDNFIYIPIGGKVIDVLKIFQQNNINYQLKSEPLL